MNLSKLCTIALAATVAIPLQLRAQGATGGGTIQGVVRSEGVPVVGASVSIAGTSLGGLTRADGRYTITGVPPSAGTREMSPRPLATKKASPSKTTR